MFIQSIFSALHKNLSRRNFLQHSAAAASIIATFSGNSRQTKAKALRRSALADPATRSSDDIYFGVIGDYGREDRDVATVAAMIRSWNPDFITTVGDNIYDYESEHTVDSCIGQYFTRFLSPYDGEYGPDSGVNRFYPILGNHDWGTIEVDEQGELSGPYFDFFPERESYYTFQYGPVRFFMLDSDDKEPDGTEVLSTQAMWLRDQLALSTATWNLVYLHHPPYSSGIKHGAYAHLRWPFRQWGAHAVLSGHNHTYERINFDNIAYFVNGLGGASLHGLSKPRIEGSQSSYTGAYGAMLVSANTEAMTFQFLNANKELIDSYTMFAADFLDLPEPAPTKDYNRQTLMFTQRLASATDYAVEQQISGTTSAITHLLDFGTPETDEFASAVRFVDIPIPSNAIIDDAYIEFTASEISREAATAQIYGEKSCYAYDYGDDAPSIGDRASTSESVEWSNIEPWNIVGASYWTPNLATIVQEIIEQPLWQEGRSIAFALTGWGKRTAISFELQPQAAPRLHVKYTIPLLSESLTTASSATTTNNDTHKIYLPSIALSSCDIPDEE